MEHYNCRCISAVHIRRCSVIGEGLVLQLGLSLGLGSGSGILSFFPFVNVTDIICCALLACIVDVRHQYDIIGDEAW